jgi:hypothetical protein
MMECLLKGASLGINLSMKLKAREESMETVLWVSQKYCAISAEERNFKQRQCGIEGAHIHVGIGVKVS